MSAIHHHRCLLPSASVSASTSARQAAVRHRRTTSLSFLLLCWLTLCRSRTKSRSKGRRSTSRSRSIAAARTVNPLLRPALSTTTTSPTRTARLRCFPVRTSGNVIHHSFPMSIWPSAILILLSVAIRSSPTWGTDPRYLSISPITATIFHSFLGSPQEFPPAC